MDKFMTTRNIENFRKLLAATVDDKETRELQFLLTREEGRLVDILRREQQTMT